ncbi:MAG: PAS domain S-box protein [Prolixibacteraceae bacterium]|nr:PAS domain S-box protein [Prolixibacteraceae bacterium]
MIKILAIDDNKDNLITLGAIIKDSFREAVFVNALSGKEGIEFATSENPDVILLDIIMPDLDGFEVCRRLKQDERTRDIPVIFLTAMKESKDVRIKALEVGGEAFLYKPIDEPELVAQIGAMFKIRQFANQRHYENERLSQLVAERTQELEQSHTETLKLIDELKAENEKYRKTEDELKDSEELFRNIFEYHTAVKLIIDPDTENIIDANQAAVTFYGWTKEQLKQMKIQEINTFTPEEAMQSMERAKANKQNYFEFCHRLADGSIRDVEVFSSSIQVKGKVLLHSIVHDVSDRKRAEQEIKQEVSRFESLYRINQFSADTIQQLLDFALGEAISLTKSKIGYIFFYDENKKEFNLNTWSKEVMRQCSVMEPQTVYELDKTGIWGEAVRQRKSIMVNDFEAPNCLKMGIPEGHAQLQKFLTIPVFSGEKIVAVVGVANKQDDYNDIDILQLSLMMDAVWKSVLRQKSEEDIAASEARLKRAELSSSSGNWELHLDSQTIYTSDGARMIYGLDSDQIDYSIIKSIPLPEYRPLLNEVMKNLIEKNIPYDIEFKIKTLGTGIIKNIHSIATFDKERRTVFGVIQDITDRKRSEEALRESENKFRTLFTQMSEGFALHELVYDVTHKAVDYKIIDVNPAFEKQIGIQAENAKGALASQLYGVSPAPFLDIYAKVAETGEHHFFQTYFSPLDRHFQISVFSPNPGYFATIFVDITERKKAEEALKNNETYLRELVATKDKFFSIIAHDLKNPFNSILGLSNLLVEQIQEKNFDGIEEYARIIQKSSTTVFDLLMNLLEWARSQTGRMEFSREYIELGALINEVIELSNESAHQKSITIIKELPRNLLVYADKAMINTILRNLISNAIKFTYPGGQIIISAEKKPDELKISISDNGIGIKKEAIGKLFRIDENNTRIGTQNERGTGLGLILCKEFIEKHHGKIWVESELGKGSKFSFTIPKN